MHERDLWWKIVIVGALSALAFSTVWPIDEKIKFGIDLYGGYSLLYEIDDTGLTGADKASLAENVMRVLQERVDPKGVYNLVWRPVGHNRLEIQMPRPSEEVRAARADFERLQEELKHTALHRSDILRAVAKSGNERASALAALVRGVDRRTPLLQAAARAYDAYKDVEARYQERVKQIESDNLSMDEIHEAVKKTGSERTAAIEALIRGIPQRRELLEAAAKAWDEYNAVQAAARSDASPGDPQSTQPTAEAAQDVASKKRAFEAAVRKVLAANVDPNKLTEGATIDKVVELEEAFDITVSDLLATNVEFGLLQKALDTKPGSDARAESLKQLTTDYPGLVELINGLLDASDRLRKRRKGEGRLEDPADLQRLLRGAGVLEFRILAEPDPADPTQFDRYRESLQKRGPRPRPGEQDYQWFEIEDPVDFLRMDTREKLEREFEARKAGLGVIAERSGDKYYVLAHIGESYTLTHRPGETEWSLRSARFGRDRMGRPAIDFTLDERGGAKFAILTRLYKKRQLCIFLDDLAISQATIQSVIRTRGQISGSFTPLEVREMVKKLNAGSLPRKLKDPPISVRSIGPSLGEANRTAGLRAAQYGAICVAIFMVIYYFYAGTIAVIAVFLNILFTGAMMASLGATLTLPGIAGLVLAIGMAVDANVLINERIREELERGTAMRMAIKLGYERAFRAILDSNVTTILTCTILYFLGSEEIKGFGLTLGLGVFINLFTAYFVTRMFFELMSTITVPREVLHYPVYAAVAFAAGGGLLYGLGYWLNDEFTRDQSLLILFGKALAYVGPVIVGLLLLMRGARAVHRAFQGETGAGTGRSAGSRLPMLRLIGSPNINWIGKRYAFFTLSAIMVVGGATLFFTMDPRNLYDIEFLGGTAAQIDLKEGSTITRLDGPQRQTEISRRLEQSGQMLTGYAQALANATVTGTNNTYTVNTPGVPAAKLVPIIRSVLDEKLQELSPITYSDPAAESVTIRTRPEANIDRQAMEAIVAKFADRFRQAGEAISSSQVQAVQIVGAEAPGDTSFEIVTRETAKEVVIGAIMETLRDEIDVQPALTFKLLHDDRSGGVPYFPIRTDKPQELGFDITKSEAAGIDLGGWEGGVALVLDRLDPPQRLATLKERLRAMRLQPGFENYGWRESDVFGLRVASAEVSASQELPALAGGHGPDDAADGRPAASGDARYSRVLVVVADENYPLLDEQGTQSLAWVTELAEAEVKLLEEALTRQTSLSQITQFDQQVSGEAQTDAFIALGLSWLVIIIYVWFRFGNIRWGLAAVTALVHDVVIAAGCVAASYYIADTPIGKALLIDKFRVDLALVAAFLTVIGYSVNDTIVVFDRIRENRGRHSEVNAQMINESVSQTLSRTVLTLLTSLIAVLTMYILGGRGIHGFNYVLFIGLAIGTYSSIGVAGQFLIRRGTPSAAPTRA